MSSMTSEATGRPAVSEPPTDYTTIKTAGTTRALESCVTIANPNYERSTSGRIERNFLFTPKKTRRSAWRLLSHPTFRLYFFGALASNLGTWLQSTAQILIAYDVTHSVFMVGLITSAQFAGMVLVSPWAAVVADWIGAKTLLIGTQGASALVAAYMAWRYHTGLLGVHTLVLGALTLGFAYALALPVQTALVPALVDPSEAQDAVKMNSVSYNAGRALAPALCVLVIAAVGRDVIFLLNAASFVIFAACLAIVIRRVRGADKRMTTSTPQAGNEPALHRRARVTDGLMIALFQPRILLLLAIVAAVTLADDPVLVLSPALAHLNLHLSNDWAGYFIAALGWGSVLGSLTPTSARACNPKSASQRAAISLFILGVSVIIFTLGLSAPVSLIAAVVAGAAGLSTGSAAQTALLRHQTNDSTSMSTVASVAALWAIAWAGTKPFASLLDGWLASHFNILPTTIVLVLPALTIAFCEIRLKESRKMRIRELGVASIVRIIKFLCTHSEVARESAKRAHTPSSPEEITVIGATCV